MADDDEVRRNDEVAAVRAIFDEDVVSAERDKVSLRLQPPSGREGEPLVVRYAMPGKYPSTERPRVQLAHVLSDGYGKDFEVPPERLDEIRRELDGIADAMPGLELLTEWTTALQTTLAPLVWAEEAAGEAEPEGQGEQEDAMRETRQLDTPSDRRPSPGPAAHGVLKELGVVHGEPLESKRSVFQAHVCRIDGPDAYRTFMSALLENRKIASCTHNITAHRYTLPSGTQGGDCDDDGESAAGGRLLHLLEVMDARDVAVCVSRWFGGTLLGPDRFKLINNAARILLESEGFRGANTSANGRRR